MPKPNLQLSQPVAIIIAGIIVAGAILLTHYIQPAQQPAAQAAAAQQLPTSVKVRPPSASDHIIGSPNAPIVLIEYTDFQCPYCQLIYPSLKQIVSQSNGKIAWVIRNFPLYQIHPQAENAANAAECIAAQGGNTAYWQFVDTDFNNQNDISPTYFASIAKSLGLNMQEYTSCVNAKTYQNRIDTDEQEAETSGGQGTPYTIVYGNGLEIPISGALPEAQIMSIIQTVESSHA